MNPSAPVPRALDIVVPIRNEVDSIDEAEHAEGAYDLTGSAGQRAGSAVHATTRTAELDV